MTNLQHHYHFKLDFQNVDQHTGGKWLIHRQAWNSPLGYLSRESNHDIEESNGNIFNPEKFQMRKHPGSWAFAEPEQLSYRKPKRVVQHEKDGHENPNNSPTPIMMKIMMQ